MTEAEWLAATDPGHMLSFLWMNGGERKPRLLAVAVFRRAVATVTAATLEEFYWQDIDLAERIELAERIAEGLSAPDKQEHRYEFHSSIMPGSSTPLEWAAHSIADPSGWKAASGAVLNLAEEWDDVEAGCGAALVRDIFGNPFRPVTFGTAWQTSTVLALAEGIYADRAFDRLPILADALQDAGCDSDDILNHCRGDWPHVRGCWVVDLVLGKS